MRPLTKNVMFGYVLITYKYRNEKIFSMVHFIKYLLILFPLFCFVGNCDIYTTRFCICRSNKTALRSVHLFEKHWKISKQNFTSKQTSDRTKQRRIFVWKFICCSVCGTIYGCECLPAFVTIIRISNIIST